MGSDSLGSGTRSELVVAEFEDERQADELDSAIVRGDYKTLQVVGQPEGIVSYVYGGF